MVRVISSRRRELITNLRKSAVSQMGHSDPVPQHARGGGESRVAYRPLTTKEESVCDALGTPQTDPLFTKTVLTLESSSQPP